MGHHANQEGQGGPSRIGSNQHLAELIWRVRSQLEAICCETLCCSNPVIPSLWARVQIAWLPNFMVLLKAEAHPYIMNILQSTPQFAYRSGVSTIDAILRVGAHCSAVRKDIEDQIPELVGGLALSLDLSKAFECLAYAEMWEAMVFAGMPDYLIRLILHVRLRSVCDIVHGSYSSTVQMKRGLRQGCPRAYHILCLDCLTLQEAC